VPVHAQHPRHVGWDLVGDLEQRARERRQRRAARGTEVGGAGREQHFGLEHEAIPDHPDVAALAEHLLQATEELRSIARHLGHLFRERAEALAEVGDGHLVARFFDSRRRGRR
jgi:hypothetical protein